MRGRTRDGRGPGVLPWIVPDFPSRTMTDPAVPTGFTPHFRHSPLTRPWEPLYSRITDDAVIMGLHVREPHCNSRGFVHGGLVSALADNAMGLSVGRHLQPGGIDARERRAVTVNLAIDYLGSGQIGQWLVFEPRVLKVTRTLAFVDCVVSADGKPIARGNATFRLA